MDPRKLSSCYTKHHRRLYLVALGVTMNREAAEDAVHDALERMLRVRAEPRSLLQYMMRAVRNAAIDAVRRSRLPKGDQPLEAVLDPNDAEADGLDPKRVSDALAELRRDEREVIWLHIYADLSFREIAELREVSQNTVSSWYRRGIAKLQKVLEEDDEPNRNAVTRNDSKRAVR